MTKPTDIEERIAAYLGGGGVSNPAATAVVVACRDEIYQLTARVESFHEILARKNTIIRLLAMGDCTAQELGLSDAE